MIGFLDFISVCFCFVVSVFIFFFVNNGLAYVAGGSSREGKDYAREAAMRGVVSSTTSSERKENKNREPFILPLRRYKVVW